MNVKRLAFPLLWMNCFVLLISSDFRMDVIETSLERFWCSSLIRACTFVVFQNCVFVINIHCSYFYFNTYVVLIDDLIRTSKASVHCFSKIRLDVTKILTRLLILCFFICLRWVTLELKHVRHFLHWFIFCKTIA